MVICSSEDWRLCSLFIWTYKLCWKLSKKTKGNYMWWKRIHIQKKYKVETFKIWYIEKSQFCVYKIYHKIFYPSGLNKNPKITWTTYNHSLWRAFKMSEFGKGLQYDIAQWLNVCPSYHILMSILPSCLLAGPDTCHILHSSTAHHMCSIATSYKFVEKII